MKYEEIESFNQIWRLPDSCKREQTRKISNLHHQSQSVDVYILRVIFGTKKSKWYRNTQGHSFSGVPPEIGVIPPML